MIEQPSEAALSTAAEALLARKTPERGAVPWAKVAMPAATAACVVLVARMLLEEEEQQRRVGPDG